MSDETTTEGNTPVPPPPAAPKRERKPGEDKPDKTTAVKWRAKRDNTLRGRYYRKGETLDWSGKEAPSEHFERIK